MVKILVSYAIGALALLGNPALASEVCTSYTVSPGDTLRLISERYYGTRDLSSIIYSANISTIGDDPNTIEIGMDLAIPCRDGLQIEDAPAFLTMADTTTNAEQSDPAKNTAPEFLSVAGNSPFVASDGTGLLPSILTVALKRGGYAEALTISRPETYEDTLRLAALPNAQLSFPVIQPNCDNPERLSPQSQTLCEQFTFSNPLFQITLGVFVLADSHLKDASAPNDFNHMRFCLPHFHTDDVLRAFNITSQSIAQAPSLDACYSELQSGAFDAIVADYMSVEALGKAGLVDIPAFATQTTLHATAHSENLIALNTLIKANAGLQIMLESGEWFEIVEAHMPQRNN